MLAVDPIERDFLEAIERLIAGRPRSPELIELAAAGKLKITIKSVAMESGRSRTLIGMDNCRYPEIRNRILAVKATDSELRRHDVASSTDSLAKARAELKLALEQVVAHFHARQIAEREADRWREAFRRLQDEVYVSSNGVVKFPRDIDK